MLKTIIDRYGKEKAELDAQKKIVDEDNAKIKELMTADNLENAIGDEFKATCKTIVSENFNEDKLLVVLKKMNVPGVIKTKEYVDMEELENAIYNGEIDATKLASCKERKETLRLTVSRIKK